MSVYEVDLMTKIVSPLLTPGQCVWVKGQQGTRLHSMYTIKKQNNFMTHALIKERLGLDGGRYICAHLMAINYYLFYIGSYAYLRVNKKKTRPIIIMMMIAYIV